jgi:hypothetical protein
MEPGDGQEVHQAGLGEAILQIALNAAAAAYNQSVHQRSAGAIE